MSFLLCAMDKALHLLVLIFIIHIIENLMLNLILQN